MLNHKARLYVYRLIGPCQQEYCQGIALMRSVFGGATCTALGGLAAEAALLAVLDGTVALGGAGWAAGMAVAAATNLALARALIATGRQIPTPADRVTLLRATLVGAVTALTADSFTRPAPTAALVTLAAVALMLDAVDGRVARRTGTATPLGARFDME